MRKLQTLKVDGKPIAALGYLAKHVGISCTILRHGFGMQVVIS